MTDHMRNIMKYFKPVYFVWLLGIMLLIVVYFYGDKNLDYTKEKEFIILQTQILLCQPEMVNLLK